MICEMNFLYTSLLSTTCLNLKIKMQYRIEKWFLFIVLCYEITSTTAVKGKGKGENSSLNKMFRYALSNLTQNIINIGLLV